MARGSDGNREKEASCKGKSGGGGKRGRDAGGEKCMRGTRRRGSRGGSERERMRENLNIDRGERGGERGAASAAAQSA
eukprot:4810319-Pyramimonas_sp.AAC.1